MYPPQAYYPPQHPPGQYPSPVEYVNPVQELWQVLRKMVHAFVLFGFILLMLFVMVDLAILAWSHWPVAEAALRFDSYSVIFAITPGPVGEATWTGWSAIAAGAVLLFIGFALQRLRRGGAMPGLAGIGTGIMALLFGLGGAVLLAFAGYLAATGHMTDGLVVPNVLPTPIGLMVVQFTLLTQWHSIMIGAILMSAVMMFIVDGPPLAESFRRSIRRSEIPTIRTDNTWIMVPRMYLAIVGFYVLYFIILKMFTVTPEVPDFAEDPLWRQLHSFAVASVWEEVLTRILLLGVPLALYHVLAGGLRHRPHRYLVGGGLTIDTAVFVLIFIQSMVFALAHVSGWDLWKVLPTLISGMAFGYLFMRKGLWAAIILHFTFDYLGMTTTVFLEWGIDINNLFNLVYIMLVVIGFILLVHYIIIIIDEGPDIVRTALWGPRPSAEAAEERFNGPQHLRADDRDEGPEEGPPRGHDEAPGGERR